MNAFERWTERALKQLWKQIEDKNFSPEKKAEAVYCFIKIRDCLVRES